MSSATELLGMAGIFHSFQNETSSMNERKNWELLVFREGKRTCNPSDARRQLISQIERVLSLSNFESLQSRDEIVHALLRAGELECGLEDSESSAAAALFSVVSDELARALVNRRRPNFNAEPLGNVASIPVPAQVSISPPEGFCYYALHPLDYVDLLHEARIEAPASAIIGIRSIGTTLSAVVKAALEVRGASAQRITVRPSGHPFDRKLMLNSAQQEWVRDNAQRNTMFFIVDEGPGLSGSSFLSVAEALVEAGVAEQRIILLPASKPNLSALFAPNASARWSKFRTLSLSPTKYIPGDSAVCLSGGEWRKRVFPSRAEWPGVWSWTERQKYISKDGSRIYRFDGHAHYGNAVRRRSELLAEYGWGPKTSLAGDGFSVSPWVDGIRSCAVDRQIVMQLARYCAFRAEHFACEMKSAAPLEEMAEMNLERALGISRKIELPIDRPVIADARMMPHEWIRISPERMLKVDAASHGDDHFYPGPTDIAWDLAGAIAQWELDEEAAMLLTSEYHRISGDRINGRLPDYLMAYCAFRLAFTSSAAISVNDPCERERFNRESDGYRTRLIRLLEKRKSQARPDCANVTDPAQTADDRMLNAECRVAAFHE